jgi:hypothetical protein
MKQPINRLLMLGKRGLGGPFFQRVGQRLFAIGPPNTFDVQGGLLNISDVCETWVDQGFWISGTVYAGCDVVEHLGRFFAANVGHTAGAVNEPGVGASWKDSWTEVSSTGIPERADIVIAVAAAEEWGWTDSVATIKAVDWGDGTVEQVNATAFTHIYASAGDYNVRLAANTFDAVSFSNKTTRTSALVGCNAYGHRPNGDYSNLFISATNTRLNGAVVPNINGATNLTGSFRACKLISLPEINTAPGGASLYVAFFGTSSLTFAETGRIEAKDCSLFAQSAGHMLNADAFVLKVLDVTKCNRFSNFGSRMNFSQAAVDKILRECVAGVFSNVTLDINTPLGSEPSVAGWADVATLIGRGWTVTYNGTPPAKSIAENTFTTGNSTVAVRILKEKPYVLLDITHTLTSPNSYTGLALENLESVLTQLSQIVDDPEAGSERVVDIKPEDVDQCVALIRAWTTSLVSVQATQL